MKYKYYIPIIIITVLASITYLITPPTVIIASR